MIGLAFSRDHHASSSPASGSSIYYAFDDDDVGERCAQVTASSNPSLGCTSPPTGATTYSWTAFGQLAQVTSPSTTTSYDYDARGLRVMTASTGSATTMASYDMVDGGSIPEMLSDGTNSYVYGPEVMGEVTPVEQISSSGATSFCFSAPSGVQAVIAQGTSSTPAALSELAAYSITGIQTLSALGITTTSAATPFGFQGAYQDATGFDYLYNRVYDPRSAQMLSVDPKLLTTEDPYSLDGGDSLNMSDPLGLYLGCNGESCGPGSGWRENGGGMACSSNCGASYPTGSGNSYSEQLPDYAKAAANAAIGRGWIAGAEYEGLEIEGNAHWTVVRTHQVSVDLGVGDQWRQIT